MTAQPFKGRKGFDSNNHPVANVKAAEELTDAVNLAQLKQELSDFKLKDSSLDVRQVNNSMLLMGDYTLCNNSQEVTHSLGRTRDKFVISNHLASAPVTITSDMGIINTFLDKSANVGLEWEKLDIKNGSYTVQSANGHLLYNKTDSTLNVLGDNVNVLIENVMDFSITASGQYLYFTRDRDLYKVVDLDVDNVELIYSNCSRVNAYDSSVVVINSSGEISYSIDAGNAFKKMDMKIPAKGITATSLQPAIYTSNQIQYLDNVYSMVGTIKKCISTVKGVLVVTDQHTTCTLHLVDSSGIKDIHKFNGQYQCFESNKSATKQIMLLNGVISVSDNLTSWINYKTDISASQLSLNSDSTSLLAIGRLIYKSKYSEDNKSVKLDGFTMLKNSTVELIKSKELGAFVVINQSSEPYRDDELEINSYDTWMDEQRSYVKFVDEGGAVYLTPEPKDGFKCELIVPMLDVSEDRVNVYSMGNKILNGILNPKPVDERRIGTKRFVTFDNENWVEYDPDYKLSESTDILNVLQGSTVIFIYSAVRGGWIIKM